MIKKNDILKVKKVKKVEIIVSKLNFAVIAGIFLASR